MPRAEVGSSKYIANQMKSKGLQRLRWYCQACERQMRDENGFKCHVASESHVRNMVAIGEDPRKAINEFSNQFQRDFIQLLRTGHGEKKVNVNHFYQEYIGNKEHIHMNATKWASLTEFAKFLGREGICRVEEDEKNDGKSGASGLTISWIDNSPEALRRQDAIRKKDRQDKGDEEREQRLIRDQIRKARRNEDQKRKEENEELSDSEEVPSNTGINRKDGEKVVLSFGTKKSEVVSKPPSPPLTDREEISDKDTAEHSGESMNNDSTGKNPNETIQQPQVNGSSQITKPAIKPLNLLASKPKNVFATVTKKNALSGQKKTSQPIAQKPMSEAERIMKEEIERKRQRERNGGNVFKKQRLG